MTEHFGEHVESVPRQNSVSAAARESQENQSSAHAVDLRKPRAIHR